MTRQERPRRAAPLRALRGQAVALCCVAAAILMWTVGFAGADPRQMGALGLLTFFNTAIVGAILLLLGSALVCVYQQRPQWVVGVHLVTYLALVHGTPALMYDNVRYAWSYKHLGVVDFILRTGTVDTGIDVNPIYHNWPGVFAGSALIAGFGGEDTERTLALWAPLVFNLILLVVLRYLFRGLTSRSDVVGTALIIYFTMTWVGQDYFSPQAVVYILYIAVVGLLLRGQYSGWLRTALFALLVAAMAVSHQITLVMLLMALTALLVLHQIRGWHLLTVAVAIIGAWALTFADDFTLTNLADLVWGFGQPLANAEETFSKSDGATGLQKLVVVGDRFTVGVAAAFAVFGAWRSRRDSSLSRPALILMLAPVAILGMMSFGGEALLRVFLFAAPFIAFLAAQGCAPRTRGTDVDYRRLCTVAAVVALVLPGFFLGYYGKERQSYFTAEEVGAFEWLAENAPAGSLLVEGDTNYPRQFRNYEKFDYVVIAREPASGRIVSRPVARLGEWLSDARFVDGYVVITRSQKIGIEMDHSMRPGSLDRIEDALRSSPLFTVVHESRDATVFTLSELGRR